MRVVVSDKRHLSYVRNSLDGLGLLLNLPRLPGEDNAGYRVRLEDVFARPGNATYRGLLAALAREFGYTLQEAATVDCRGAGGQPRVVLKDQTLYLYLSPTELEASWFLREPSVETVGQLVAAINQTGRFSAALADGMSGDELCLGLVQGDSHVWVLNETVPASRSFRLAHAPIVHGSVVFDEEAVFRRFADPPAEPGDYCLDADTGLVQTVLLPSGGGKVAYQYRQDVVTLYHQPVGLLDLNSPAARAWFFATVPKETWEGEADRASPAFPYPFMQRVIEEINQNCPALWGP